VAGVDDAETVAFGVGKNDKIGIVGVGVPVGQHCSETNEAVDLSPLFGRIVDHQVQVNPRVSLGRSRASLNRDSGPDSVSGNKNREVVFTVRELHRLVVEHGAPKSCCPVDVLSSQHHSSKTQHVKSVACFELSVGDGVGRIVLWPFRGNSTRSMLSGTIPRLLSRRYEATRDRDRDDR